MNSSALLRVCALVALASLLLVACGDDDSGSAFPGSGQSNGEDEPNGSDSNPDDIDFGERPAPGQARMEVDGRTFTGDLHSCQLISPEASDEVTGVLVGASTEDGGESVEFGTNGGRAPGSRNWTVQSGVTIGGGIAYTSGNGNVAVDGRSMVYVGDFAKARADGSGFDDVGEGRLVATCP